MDVVNEILEKSAKEALKYKPITVEKHLELEYDLGTLLAVDMNDFDTTKLRREKNDYFLNLARDNTQLLLNQLWDLPTEKVEEAIMVKLPKPKTLLPRMKPVPRPKPLTKWQKFAQEKGIQKKKKPKLSWDEQLKQWIPLYGFKRAKAEKEKNWVLEVPQNADPNEDQFAKKTVAKTENVAKNELQRLRNIAKGKKIKVPRVGVTNPEVSSAKDLQAAVTVAKASTASLGKFQDKLPKEKEARGVTEITPGASRKRKMPPVAGDIEKRENLNIVETILNKRPKLDIEKAVAKQVQATRMDLGESTQQERRRGDNKSKSKSKIGKKPSGGKGQRTGGKKGGGRKRR
ncbi:ribosome biogenesis regulatory protein homolog [Anthonomus grandis grandis]|uniref:ribosome biogenesis regulatory protein homolog n=1 Tax=Anthonomus grandis grandis TaxID=2921223 RepID=UPI0021652373|nr:ribosome biogenesis regulatory protein homolog [Anthonomus grandis grandis]